MNRDLMAEFFYRSRAALSGLSAFRPAPAVAETGFVPQPTRRRSELCCKSSGLTLKHPRPGAVPVRDRLRTQNEQVKQADAQMSHPHQKRVILN
jgi:hypothetical protein